MTVNRSALVFLDKEHAPEATEEELLQETFSNLATDWKASTAAWSSIARRYAHPSYQAILALGKDAIPLILNELKNRPDYWFAALRVLTKDSPVGPEVGFDQAVEGWLAWGKAHGHLD
ncbi:MAG: hypothetical protein AUI36_34350 [Cyanobacteria bacterium 13_1_40CM_2_61_4]|nr:MAG: hypothetical protein AUI36_34350 [Cyanobacteria bacterium 13_1_40CM_2_61_4]